MNRENYLVDPLASLEALSPSDAPELYQSILLGTAVSPGVVALSGHDRNKAWDIQEAKGTTGATTKLKGDPVGQFQASFYLADNDDRAAWAEFKRVVESTTNGPEPLALPIYHPDLAANGFTEVVQAGIGGMVHDDRGGSTVIVKFIEYSPPKPKPARSARASASANDAGTEEEYDPNAARRAELAALYEEANRP